MNTEKLPKGYSKIDTVHLEKDKKHRRRINLIAMILAVLVAIVGHMWQPFDDASLALLGKTRVLLAMLGVLFLFTVVHEMTHALLMYLVSRVKPRIVVKGLYCYSGSAAHFDRRSYLLVELLPVLFWGIVLLVLCFILPESWFWLVQFVQIANFAGAAADVYSAAYVLKKPKTILIQDLGNGMKIYGPDNE